MSQFLIIKLRERRYRLGQSCLWADTWGLCRPKIWMKPCPEYYDVRTELELVPTTTMERSSMITLTSSVNYSSHQRHLGSQPKGSVRGTDWVINGREDTELTLASRVGENYLLSITTSMLLAGDKRIQLTNIIKYDKKDIVHFLHGVGPSMKGADIGWIWLHAGNPDTTHSDNSPWSSQARH